MTATRPAERHSAPPIAAIVGPTGSGKSALALAVSQHVAIEILVADSRQIYRGMQIGTAGPDAVDRATVRHHLVDLADPGTPISAASWVAQARRVIPEVAARGHLAVLVGGSGLLVTSLLDGYQFSGAPDPDLRAKLAAEVAAVGVGPLAARLLASDPVTAARVDLRNPRRVTRALERLAGGEVSAASPRSEPWPGPIARIGLARTREVLHRRIGERAAWLFANGLLDEVQALLETGLDPRRPPMTSHGYGEAARVLAGEWSLDQAIDVTALRTRQYARRQMTWFGRDSRITWLDAGDRPGDDPQLVELAAGMLGALSSEQRPRLPD
jgi:tRNA dimethylallyltransferase